MIHRAVREAVAAVPGVTQVTVEQTESELWTEERMEPDARARLLAARQRRREQLRAARYAPAARSAVTPRSAAETSGRRDG